MEEEGPPTDDSGDWNEDDGEVASEVCISILVFENSYGKISERL